MSTEGFAQSQLAEIGWSNARELKHIGISRLHSLVGNAHITGQLGFRRQTPDAPKTEEWLDNRSNSLRY
jgi:hypothetical protein